MPLSDHVSINITQDTVGVKRAGYGVALILSYNATFPERARSYTDLPGLVADGFGTDSPEYRSAEKMLSQELRPERIVIGRGALKPTQRYSITLGANGALSSHAYQVNVAGEGFVDEERIFTSDGTATSAEIAAGIVAALNGVVGKNYTAALTTGDFPVVVTATAPGEWFSLEVANVADLAIVQNHADPGVATDLTAIALAYPDFYAVHTMHNSEGVVLATAAWAEANERIYVFDVSDSASITAADGSGDTLSDWHADGYARSLGSYHPSPANFMSAALLGKVLPMDPGSETWKWKNLVGVEAVTITSTQAQNLRDKNANSYETVAGRGMTWEGTTADGGFLDRVRGRDWIKDDMAKGVYEVLAANPKIPFTDAGINMIEAPMRATLRRATRMGILAPGVPGDAVDFEPTVEVPRARDVASVDRARRLLPDLKWRAREAGAVHKAIITGVVSL